MTYQETLFFIGKILTINSIEKNKIIVKKRLEKKDIDWEVIVKVSTSHFVFPAIYCNLKNAGLLAYLPEDLVQYMVHITNLNRDRNSKIIDQAKQINNLLIANNIKPIFLKGTGNLLKGLYNDIGERMVGDIDFIVPKNQYQNSIDILKKSGYHEIEVDLPDFFRHYPRLTKKDCICAVEVHKKLLKDGFHSEFNYNHIQNNLIEINSINFISYPKQFIYNILVHQINDYGYNFNTISLRKAYDSFLISQKTEIKNITTEFTLKIHCFIAASNELLNCSLSYSQSKKTDKYVKQYLHLLNIDHSLRQKNKNKIAQRLEIKRKLRIIIKSFYKKDYLKWVLKKMN